MFKLTRKPSSLPNQKIIGFHNLYFKFFLFVLFFFSSYLSSFAQVCGTSGLDGPKNLVPPINTYYPLSPSTTLSAGSRSIILNGVPPNDPNFNLSYGVTPIQSGDLILIIQMQDASFNYTNSNLYGSGTATSGPDNLGGTGYTSLNNSGKFEYVVATSNVPLTGGTLTFRGAGVGSGCVYTYTNLNGTTGTGQKRFQVVRVPQYSNLVLSANITTPPYNGLVGGLIAFDVAGTMQFNGFAVDASELGFRGGYGPVAASNANDSSLYVAPSSSTKSVGKGEGIAGTPRYMWDGFNQVDNGSDGLPGGSYGRGAPANGGGGGNDHNAGGGGGGNGGYGGLGGMGWQGAGGNLDPLTGGGRPGYLLPIDYSRLIMGGGGGGGDANNATTGVKGGVGGGIIIINVEKIDGIGVIKANGGNGQPGVYGSAPDGAGGGGAGGTIFIRSLASSPTANLTLEVNGGNGGNTLYDNNNEHGPGGGGGGGVIYAQVPSAIISSSFSKGNGGKSNNGAGIQHGSKDGTIGRSNSFITSDLPSHLQGGGSICYPALDVSLKENNPGSSGSRLAGSTATYKLKVYNNMGGGNAGDVYGSIFLPTGFSLTGVTATLSGDAAGSTSPSFTSGSTGIISFGPYNISPGDYVEFVISVKIAGTVPNGIYNASAQATYLDPTRTNANPIRKITANNNPFAGSNTSYESGGIIDVPGVNYNGYSVSSTAEDVYINSLAVINSCNNAVTGGGFDNYTTNDYPSGIGPWTPLNSGEIVKIVDEGILRGAAISKNLYSLKQQIQSIKASSSYTFFMNMRRWTSAPGGCNPNSNASFRIRVYDPANPSVYLLDYSQTTNNNTPVVINQIFNTGINTSSLVLVIEETTSGTPACPLFLDDISINSAISISYSSTNVTCYGANDGKIKVDQLSGAAAPYQISYSSDGGISYSTPQNSGPISTSGTPFSFINLTPRSYILKIIDANGCLNTRDITISEPTALTLTESHIDVLCNSGTTSLSLTASGGTGAYTYSKDGTTYQTGNTFTSLTAGSYTFTVKDVNGCTKTTGATITEPTELTLTESHTNLLCNGAMTSLSLTASGGTGAYTYSKDGTTYQSSATFNGLTAGSYTFTVKDVNGCIKTLGAIITEPISLSLIESHTSISCNGGTSTVILTATGGTGAYQFSKDGTTYQTSNIFNNLVAGSYTFYVKDANGCTFSTPSQITITEPTVLTLSSSKTNILCNGGTSTVTLTATGGTGVYTYSKNGTTFQASNIFPNLTSGSYTFTVKDANDCTFSTPSQLSITEPAAIALTESHSNILCNGGTSTVTLTATGGTAVYQYSKDGTTYQTSNTFTNLIAGSYTFTVKDGNDCTTGKLIQITQPLAPISITETHQNVSCYSDVNGSIDITVNGGNAPYTYLWNNGISIQNQNNLSKGIYTVTVTDANGCQAQKSISINQPTAPLTLSETHVNNVCYGNQIGKIDITAKGGTAPYTYLWNNGKQTQDLSGLGGGNYQLNVTDANGCTSQISVVIAPLQPFQINDIVSQIKCAGAGNGSIQLNPTGGQAPYSVLWSNGQTGMQINNLIPGTYSYTAKDDYGCTLQKTFTITQPKPLAGTLKITKTTCKFSKDGNVFPLITGGISPYQYFWDDKEIPGNGSVNFLAAGKYTFKVLDANGCSLSLIADVLPGNCAPNADNDNYQTLEDTPITINTPGVVVNDSDPDDDQIKIELSSVSDPNGIKGSMTGNRTNFNTLNGKVSLSNEGSFVYTPNLNFNGIDKFIYQVSDGSIESNFATVTINVLGVNDPPIANDDNFIIPEDTQLNQTVITNDSDPENDPLTYTLITQPAKGTLIFKADGTFIYTPAPNDNGTITFDYQVCDPSGLCDTAKVTIVITPVNDPPVAEDDRFVLEKNKSFSNKVTANDYDPENDPLVWTIISNPAHGTIVFNTDGTFTYTPNNGFKGIDTYTYRTCDPSGLCDNATVTLVIQPIVTVNLKPTLATISEGQGIDITATLTESILEDVTINLVYNGTAQYNLDYSLTGNYLTITIPAGQVTTIQKFNLYAINDALQDPGEQAIINISKTSSAFVLIGTGSQITIDDIYPTTLPTGPGENPDISPDPLVSPNGDGQGNEKFVIYNISKYPNNEVVIFNRWGNEVFRIKGYNNEDKSFKGVANVGILTNSNVDLVDGVYYYLIYTEPNAQKKLNKGYLILKR